MRLFIAEKPSVAKAIAAELGVEQRCDGYYKCRGNVWVTNCFGHLLELEDPDFYLPEDVPLNNKGKKMWRTQDLPIVPRQWKKKPRHDARRQLKLIGELLKQASEVVNAGDPDREGQILVDEVLNRFKWEGTTLRYWQSAMDSKSVQRALAKLEPNSKYEPWGLAAEARSHADWLIGMNISRALTLRHHAKSVISAGRVQSTTLRLIVDRDNAIANFKSKKFYELTGEFKAGTAVYKGKWQIPSELKDPDDYLTDAQAVKNAIARMKAAPAGRITSYEQKLKSEKPKLLYTLTDLQVECSRKFGFSANKTLSIAQELYETHKLTSYPRTSCPYLPASQQGDVEPILAHVAKTFPQWQSLLHTADPKRRSALWNDAKVNEEAHTGLAPTLQEISPEKFAGISQECRQVYELICKRYAAAFMPDCTFNETEIITQLDCGDVFVSKGRQVIESGWKKLYSSDKPEDQGEEEPQNLPVLHKDQFSNLSGITAVSKNTQPPKPFTEGTLVKAMEEVAKYVTDPQEKKLLKETSGIGTAATRAGIIDRLKHVGYVKLSRSKLISTEFGRQVIEVIPKKLQSASLTADAEEELKNIQKGTGSASNFETETVRLVKAMLEETMMAEEIKSADHVEKCPKCGGNLYRNESKFKKGQFYWHCGGCKANFDDDSGRIGAERLSADCPSCGKKMSRIKSKFKDEFIWWCGGCKSSYKDDNGKVGTKIEKSGSSYPAEKCPVCGKTAKRYPNKSDPSRFHWYCPDCKSSFFDDDGRIGKKFGA